jgi:hypothetical protein
MFYAKIPMFHVEHWVTMRILAILFITISLFGCNKPNPNPELADEIYQDLTAQASEVKRETESEKKKLEGFKKDVEKAVPQTGEIKYAQKRYFESEMRIQKLEQLAKYYELKAAERVRYTRLEYLKAFKDGKPWPTEEELAAYRQYKLSSHIDGGWDSRKRVKAYEKDRGIASEGSKGAGKSENGEKKPESEPNGE